MPSIIRWTLAHLWFLPHLTALVMLALLTRRLAANLSFLQRARRLPTLTSAPGASEVRLPTVSILVPARNEARTVAACVMSLLAQRYSALEIIVLDDGSTDGTGAILDALAARDSRLNVLHSDGELPPGWNGKSYACQRLAAQARGDWLLFTDADTIHEPESILRGVSLALGLSAPLLSAFPRQRVKTWSERILVSFIIDFLPLLAVNFTALWRARPTRAAANGQYLLTRADAYRAVGGHASIAGALVDDFALASRFHARGYPVALVADAGLLNCRMYHNVREVWAGFSKNLLAALTTTPPGWPALWQGPLFAWVYASACVLPFVNLLDPQQQALAAIEIGWLLALRAVVVWRLRRSPDELITTPLAAWGVMALGIAALYRRARGGRVAWKGRTYAG